jgi:hypothetical protein
MKQLLVVLVVLVALVFGGAPFASAASSKHLQTVTCEGDVLVAHTVTVGHCSFTGPPAKHVYAKCKEDEFCRVQAYGWDNEHDMFIIERVISVRKTNPLRERNGK